MSMLSKNIGQVNQILDDLYLYYSFMDFFNVCFLEDSLNMINFYTSYTFSRDSEVQRVILHILRGAV